MKTERYNDNGKGSLFVIIGEEHGRMLSETFPELSFLFVFDINWNRDLSPWPAQRVFRKGEDFSGGADAFLEELCRELKKDREAGRRICILGYSLAGLFSLYAAEKTDLFKGAASVSGSLWYPQWIEYLEQHPVRAEAVYLSLGNKEKESRSPVMSKVEECTEKAYACMRRYTNVVFELNPGGHFDHPDVRMIKAVNSLKSIDGRINVYHNENSSQ